MGLQLQSVQLIAYLAMRRSPMASGGLHTQIESERLLDLKACKPQYRVPGSITEFCLTTNMHLGCRRFWTMLWDKFVEVWLRRFPVVDGHGA